MEVDEAEKKNFYDKYVKKMTLAIDKDGMMTIKIPDWFLVILSFVNFFTEYINKWLENNLN